MWESLFSLYSYFSIVWVLSLFYFIWIDSFNNSDADHTSIASRVEKHFLKYMKSKNVPFTMIWREHWDFWVWQDSQDFACFVCDQHFFCPLLILICPLKKISEWFAKMVDLSPCLPLQPTSTYEKPPFGRVSHTLLELPVHVNKECWNSFMDSEITSTS
jgi:hypothetical protein